MGENSKIEWTDHTFNPWIGCTKVAAGCEHCYAERDMDHHYHKVKWGPQGTRVMTSHENWRKPLRWNREAEATGERQRVFCASLADVFEDWDRPITNSHGTRLFVHENGVVVPIDGTVNAPFHEVLTMNRLRLELFALIDATPWLDWILLTKRPENVRRMWPLYRTHTEVSCGETYGSYRENVWLVTSVATQADADRNIPELLKCRDLVPVLGASAEPLLGPVDLQLSRSGYQHVDELGAALPESGDPWLRQLDWVIVGGESGPHARPMHPDWARGLRDQCQEAGVPFFFKQWGEWAPSEFGSGTRHDPPLNERHHYFDMPPYKVWRFGKKVAGRVLDGRTWDELPRATTGVSR